MRRVLWFVLALGAVGATEARVFLTQDQALRLAFAEAAVERQARFLTEPQLARARELAGVEIPSALVARYVATSAGRLVGIAYFDTHVVRTLSETVMIVVDPDDRILRIEILAFGEPEDYLPRARWLEQFPGRALDRDLALKRGVDAITGATLSAQALTAATRRILAIHQLLGEAAAAGASP